MTTLLSVVEEEARKLSAGIFQQKKVVRHLTRVEQKKIEVKAEHYYVGVVNMQHNVKPRELVITRRVKKLTGVIFGAFFFEMAKKLRLLF